MARRWRLAMSVFAVVASSLGQHAHVGVCCGHRNSRARARCVDNTVAMGILKPPDPALAGARVALRPFRVSDAAAIADSCQDPDIPRFTMMPEAMTEGGAR